MLDGEMDQLGVRMQAQRLHHLILVELDRPRRDREPGGDHLGWMPLGQELQDLAPVSYTHLDVYKRQAPAVPNQKGWELH